MTLADILERIDTEDPARAISGWLREPGCPVCHFAALARGVQWHGHSLPSHNIGAGYGETKDEAARALVGILRAAVAEVAP